MQRMNPLVTIAIPTYNRADNYLRQALSSAVEQTYKNIEIIVSDNCSNDNTESVVKGFNDSRIRYFKQKENIGPWKNFNFCLQQANGIFFLVLSDDDLIDNDFIDACLKEAKYSTNLGIIRTGTRIIDSKGKILRRKANDVVGMSTEDFFRGWFAYKTAFYPCSTLFNKHKLCEIGGFGPENNLFHDGFVIIKLAAKFGRVDVKDIKASFRKHIDEITLAVRVKDWCRDSLLLLDSMCNLVSKEHREILREEGMEFFIRLNYNRAKKIRSPLKRFITYLMVFKKFKYQCLPPPVSNFMHGNPIFFIVKFIKR